MASSDSNAQKSCAKPQTADGRTEDDQSILFHGVVQQSNRFCFNFLRKPDQSEGLLHWQVTINGWNDFGQRVGFDYALFQNVVCNLQIDVVLPVTVDVKLIVGGLRQVKLQCVRNLSA